MTDEPLDAELTQRLRVDAPDPSVRERHLENALLAFDQAVTEAGQPAPTTVITLESRRQQRVRKILTFSAAAAFVLVVGAVGVRAIGQATDSSEETTASDSRSVVAPTEAPSRVADQNSGALGDEASPLTSIPSGVTSDAATPPLGPPLESAEASTKSGSGADAVGNDLGEFADVDALRTAVRDRERAQLDTSNAAGSSFDAFTRTCPVPTGGVAKFLASVAGVPVLVASVPAGTSGDSNLIVISAPDCTSQPL